MIVTTGPPNSPYFVVLAPGDECRLTDTVPAAIAEGLSAEGIRVARFSFPSDELHDGTNRDELLAQHIRKAASLAAPHQTLVIGGLSRGARVSVALVNELGALAVLGFAYPFHSRHDPNPGNRVVDLQNASVPVQLFQGTRDSRGNREQVTGYGLGEHITVHWLEDANHALEPRLRSGHTQELQLQDAISVASTFISSLNLTR
jgi:predicted alpha/beta-hydrolase family hydrolase